MTELSDYKRIVERPQMAAKDAAIAPLIARISELESALRAIIEGDVPRPVGKQYMDRPSKHDQCTHGVWMYEDCGNCTAEFASAALKEPRT